VEALFRPAAGWSFAWYRTHQRFREEGQGPRQRRAEFLPDGFSRGVGPSHALAEIVEAIWDWDIGRRHGEVFHH